MTTFVLLLRGVNVSGHKRVPMADLRELATSLGLTDPQTYVQSGNLVVGADRSEAEVAESLQAAIENRFGFEVRVISRPATQFIDIASSHPYSSLDLDERFLHVAFLDRTPEDEVGMLIDAADYEPDRFEANGREIYLAYPNGSGRSKLNHTLLERRLGVTLTARNWRTVLKLAAMVRTRST